MTDLVKYPTDVLHAVYQTHRYTALDKLVHGVVKDARHFHGRDVVLVVNVALWDQAGRQARLYQLERQVLRAIYVLAHQHNNAIVRFSPGQLMEVLGYQRLDGNDFSPRQRQDVHRALQNLFAIYVEVEMPLGSGGQKKLYGHFLDSYGVDTDQDGNIQQYAVAVNVLIGADLSRFKLMPAHLPKLITAHGADQAVTTFADFCLMWEGQTVAWSLDTWQEKLHLDPTRRTRNQHIIERCAEWGVAHGLVHSCTRGRMQEDRRRVKYPVVIAPQRYGSAHADTLGEEERLQRLVEQFYTLLGSKASAQKLARDTTVAARLRTEGFSLDDLTFAVEWTVQHIPSVTSFGLLPHIMHQALKARSNTQQAVAARREAEARIQAQGQHAQAEEARAQQVDAFRATLTAEALEALERQAEAALAAEDVGPGHVAYGLLRRFRLNDLIEEAFQRAETQGEPSATQQGATRWQQPGRGEADAVGSSS